MSLATKTVLVLVLSVTITVSLFLVVYAQIWVPYRELGDSDWLDSASAEDRRRVAHQVLSLPVGNFHDAFVILLIDGDLDSVPYIINALKRLAFFSPNAAIGPESHGLQALKWITCHDLGTDAQDWDRWWGAHTGQSRYDIFLARFAVEGLPVADPTGERFIASLIPYLAREAYLAECAWEVAERAPKAVLETACQQLIYTGSPADRRGVVQCLWRLDSNLSIDKLRELVSDPDPVVRPNALSALNDLLRSRLVTGNERLLRWRRKLAKEITAIGFDLERNRFYVGVEKNVYLEPDAHLLAIDFDGGELIWSFQCAHEIYTPPLAREGAVFFGCRDRVVYALDADSGEPLWKKSTQDSVYSHVDFLFAVDDKLIVGRRRSVYALSQSDGQTLWTVTTDGRIDDLAHHDKHLYLLARSGDGSQLVKLSLDGERMAALDLEKWGHGIAVAADAFYIISSVRNTWPQTASLLALDATSFTARWESDLGEVWNYPQSSPVVSGRMVVAASDERISAFDRLSGKPMWTVSDAADSPLFTRYGELVLVKNNAIESRDLRSGEVTAVYPGISYGSTRTLVTSDHAVATANGGVMWAMFARR